MYFLPVNEVVLTIGTKYMYQRVISVIPELVVVLVLIGPVPTTKTTINRYGIQPI